MTERDRFVTAHDVARVANVSQALVSRAFSGKGRIANDTRQRILTVAAQLGWQPNALAAGMVTRDAPLVAVITTRLSFDWRAQVLTRLLQAFAERALKPLIFYADRDDEVDRLLVEAMAWQARGVVVTAGVVRPERAEAILKRGQFLAALNRPANHDHAFAIATDNASGGRDAAQTLLAEGRRRLLVLAGPEDSWASSRRTLGFVQAASVPGALVEVWHNIDMSVDAGLACSVRLQALPTGRRPDGVFATNDALALGLLDGLREGGTKVPDDLSVIGFDNLPSASWLPYRLTTFEQPLDQMVEGVVAHIERHRGGVPEPDRDSSNPVYCAPRLIARHTTRTSA